MADLVVHVEQSQCPICKNGLWTPNSEDSLSRKVFPIDEEALILMVKILDNLEEFKELSGKMQAIMENDHNQEVRLLSLFNVLINGIQREYNQIGKIF